MFDIQEELKKLPDKPGVYIMKDSNGEIIYIGKAVVLKNRVRQYFQSLSNQTPDQIYRINTQSGTKQLIAIPQNEVTIASLFVSPDGNNLYFTDKNNGSINKIRLR